MEKNKKIENVDHYFRLIFDRSMPCSPQVKSKSKDFLTIHADLQIIHCMPYADKIYLDLV